MEHNRDCDTIRGVYGNSKFAKLPFKTDNNWQKNSSQGNHYNGITISSQKDYTDCRVLRSQPGEIQKIEPVDMAILNMIPQGDPDLTAYLNELLRTNKPEQPNNIFWFPTPENPGKLESHTPIQTRILKEIIELKETEKFDPKESTESQNHFLERFDLTDTLLTKTEKQAIEDILVDYRDIFARHRLEVWMNTDF